MFYRLDYLVGKKYKCNVKYMLMQLNPSKYIKVMYVWW